MSFEGLGVGPGTEPADAAGATAALSTRPVAPELKIQILSSEHASLSATRSMAWNESFNRAGMFLSALSGAIVALALVAQATSFGDGFVVFAVVLLPVVLFIGVTTVVRLGATNYQDATCIIGMNRIRAAYLEIAPDLERVFVTGVHDDVRGVAITMGIQPHGSQVLHILAATPMMVSAIDSVIVGALAALVTLQVGFTWLPALSLGILGFIGSMAVHGLFGRRNIARGRASLRSLFPTPGGG